MTFFSFQNALTDRIGNDSWELADMSVTFGKHDQAITEASQQTIAMKRIIVHSQYNNTSNDFDIALVELMHDVTYNDHVHPVCLPKKDVAVGTYCIATGWGSTRTCFVLHSYGSDRGDGGCMLWRRR